MSEPVTAEDLLALGAATLGESGAGVLPSRIRAAWSGATLAAPAFPVRCSANDNLAIHVAVARAPRGSCLVADMGGERERGYWGEVLTTAAQARGLAGLVIDGGVRDIAALEAHRFPVFATGLVLRGASKRLPGTAGHAIRLDAVEIAAGDWIVGDRDGVACVPRARLGEVLARGRERARKEQEIFAALRAGRTTLELLGLDASPIDVERAGER
jgi:4-hydroxy-4-methyl-2-oxoglutarate aldolase